MKTIIRSSRLILKPIDETYAGAVLDYFQRNQAFLSEWEIERNPQFYTLDVQKQLLIDDGVNMDREQLFKVWMFKADEPERIIGSVALSNIVRGAFQSCHLGYRLDGDEQGKGYMTEAVREVITHGFQKLGFYHEGLARKYLRINGKWEDHIHMVLLNEDME